MHDNRPSVRELIKRLDEAKNYLKDRYGFFANQPKAVGELNDLDIENSNDVWQLIREMLEEVSKRGS